MIENSQTSVSLLDALRSGQDQLAWSRFYAKYSHRIVRWCAVWGIQSDQAEDIVQETFLSVYKSIGRFQYDPHRSFRSWLKTVAWRAWINLEGKPEFTNLPLKRNGQSFVSIDQIRTEFLREFDSMAYTEIFAIACERIRPKVDPVHWSAFLMSYYDSIPGPVVASTLGLSLGSVHTATCRIRKLIRDEVQKIDPP